LRKRVTRGHANLEMAARQHRLGWVIVGFLVALEVFTVLAGTGALDGDAESEISAPPTVPLGRAEDANAGRRINDIYRRVSPGVVFVQAKVPLRPPVPLPQCEALSTGTGFVLDREE